MKFHYQFTKANIDSHMMSFEMDGNHDKYDPSFNFTKLKIIYGVCFFTSQLGKKN